MNNATQIEKLDGIQSQLHVWFKMLLFGRFIEQPSSLANWFSVISYPQVRVQCYDTAWPTHTVDGELTVSVSRTSTTPSDCNATTNNNAPVFSVPTYVARVSRSASPGEVIIGISATDSDGVRPTLEKEHHPILTKLHQLLFQQSVTFQTLILVYKALLSLAPAFYVLGR